MWVISPLFISWLASGSELCQAFTVVLTGQCSLWEYKMYDQWGLKWPQDHLPHKSHRKAFQNWVLHTGKNFFTILIILKRTAIGTTNFKMSEPRRTTNIHYYKQDTGCSSANLFCLRTYLFTMVNILQKREGVWEKSATVSH